MVLVTCRDNRRDNRRGSRCGSGGGGVERKNRTKRDNDESNKQKGASNTRARAIRARGRKFIARKSEKCARVTKIECIEIKFEA